MFDIISPLGVIYIHKTQGIHYALIHIGVSSLRTNSWVVRSYPIGSVKNVKLRQISEFQPKIAASKATNNLEYLFGVVDVVGQDEGRHQGAEEEEARPEQEPVLGGRVVADLH
jgi:hypothetical protein